MILKLTIQEVQDAETKKPIKAVFGTLVVTLGSKKDKVQAEEINFVSNLSEIDGLTEIYENIVVEALAARKQHNEQKATRSKDTADSKKGKRKSSKAGSKAGASEAPEDASGPKEPILSPFQQ